MKAIPPHYIQNAKGEWCHPARAKANPLWKELGKESEVAFLTPTGTFTHQPPKRIRQSTKPLLNKTEQRYCDLLEARGCGPIFKQAFTLRLDPPYKSYKPDLAYFGDKGFIALTFVEVKGPHRFRKAGIAKAALAAKTYPQFRFELADWTGKEWKESVLTP